MSVFIGLMLILDGFLLLKENGRCGVNKILSVTTSIEFIWAIISINVLIEYAFSGWIVLAPTLYILHNLIGWIYGFFLMNKIKNEKEPQLILPNWYIKFCLTFGLVFSSISICTLILLG